MSGGESWAIDEPSTNSTKLCTIDSRELSVLTEREWELYEKEQPAALSELYRGAPWAADGGDAEQGGADEGQASPPA